VTLPQLVGLVRGYGRQGRTVVFTNGCFDLLHAGHAACLEEASRLGDVLVVAVNSDRSVRRLKGPGRPVVPQEDRANLVAALGCVGHVLLFDEETPHAVLRQVCPDVLVKGGPYRVEEGMRHPARRGDLHHKAAGRAARPVPAGGFGVTAPGCTDFVSVKGGFS
jgi:rfaE bifunctional protein nucleotidyltransferase chain/domain